VTDAVRDAIQAIPDARWRPAIEIDGDERDGAWVTELTEHLDLSAWPPGSRVIARAERPHPAPSCPSSTPSKVYATPPFLTDTAPDSTDTAPLELRHRQHARIEGRIRQAKAAGLRNLPCKAAPENNTWLEIVLAAADLVCWSKLICFADTPTIARCEIDTYCYRILHMAARLTRSGRRLNVRLDQNWLWAKTRRRLRPPPGRVHLNPATPPGPTIPVAAPLSDRHPARPGPARPKSNNNHPIDDHHHPNTLIPHQNPPRPNRHGRVKEGG
jgi:hypothetical protein